MGGGGGIPIDITTAEGVSCVWRQNGLWLPDVPSQELPSRFPQREKGDMGMEKLEVYCGME